LLVSLTRYSNLPRLESKRLVSPFLTEAGWISDATGRLP